jgi:hypothetical protein
MEEKGDGRRELDAGEYVWHFKLMTDDRRGVKDDKLREMVRNQLAALLRCVTLTDRGANLKITGFRFLDEPNVEHAIFPVDSEEEWLAPRGH